MVILVELGVVAGDEVGGCFAARWSGGGGSDERKGGGDEGREMHFGGGDSEYLADIVGKVDGRSMREIERCEIDG